MKYNKNIKLIISLIVFFSILIMYNTVFAGVISDDINGIDDTKYPGIKSAIQSLQAKHSNYNFKIDYTGIDWNEAVLMEYQGHGNSPQNLFNKSSKYTGKWYCPICGEKKYDSGWHCASIDAIKYMMDPRNSLDETSVFQFKNLETSDVTADNIRNVINSKYASYSYINNQPVIDAIVKASQDYNLNGYSILAKIVNEQGTGTSCLVKGTGHNGYGVGYYNFFNVNASGNGIDTIYNNALKYAINHGWNSAENAILGGSQYYKSQYIGRGQNTLYYQRFNVAYLPALFSHQYQQDIMGAETSGRLLRTYYTTTSTLDSVPQTFIIPVYENMPKAKSARPSTTENSEIEFTEETVLTDKLEVRSVANGGRIISYLNKGETVKALERAKNVSSDGNYWDIIVSEKYGVYGYVIRSGMTESISLPEYVFDYDYYVSMNQDIVKILGKNKQVLLSHFINSGIYEGRRSSPTFCINDYIKFNQDLKGVFGENKKQFFDHFVNFGATEGRRGSDEFDPTFYKYYYSDMTDLDNIKLMKHYIEIGRKNGRLGGLSPNIENIVYDEKVYMECNQDLMVPFGKDVRKFKIHWIQCGISEGRIGSLLFDVNIYKDLNQDLVNAIGTSNRAFFEHFVKYGVNELRRTSLVFDINTYLKNNPEVKNTYGKNYVLSYLHFKNFGISEKRNASEVFDIKTYYDSDLQFAFPNDYKTLCIHFINCGIREGRKSSYQFDVEFYKYYYSDLTNFSNKKLMEHFIESGKNEGRIAGFDRTTQNILYDEDVYKECNQDLVSIFGNNSQAWKKHWVQSGIAEGRISSLTFDMKAYKYYNQDLYNAIGTSNKAFFEHFVKYGLNESRRASFVFDVSTYLNKNASVKNSCGSDIKLAYKHFISTGVNENRETSNNFYIKTYMLYNTDLKPYLGDSCKRFYIHYIRAGKNEARIAI